MTPTAPTPTAHGRRTAELNAVAGILLGPGKTWSNLERLFTNGLFGKRPFVELTNLEVRQILFDILAKLTRNVDDVPLAGKCTSLNAVMKANPRRSTRRKHLRGGRKKKLTKPGDRK
jgi:hypothetical protein